MASTFSEDFVTFKKMITPVIIQILFWLGVAAAVLTALTVMFKVSFIQGLIALLVGPLLVRIYCELLIVIFSINDSLTELLRIAREKRGYEVIQGEPADTPPAP